MLLKESALEAGENRVKFQMEVSKPALWWPRGYGDQVQASLFSRQLASLRCGAAAVQCSQGQHCFITAATLRVVAYGQGRVGGTTTVRGPGPATSPTRDQA